MRLFERPLNDVEVMMARRHLFAPWDTGANMAHPFRVRGLSEAALLGARERIAAARPIFRAHIDWDRDPPMLTTKGDPLPEVTHLGDCDEGDLARLVEEVVNRPPGKLFLNFYWASIRDTNDIYLIYAGREPFCDNATVIELVYDFICAAAGEELSPIEELPPQFNEVVSDEEFVAASKFVGPLIESGLVRSARPKPLHRLTPVDHAPATFVLHTTLDEAETSALLAKARAEKATLTGAFGAAFALAAATADHAHIRFQTPIGLRHMVQRDVSRRGMMLAGLAFGAVSPLGRPFWDVAREVSSGLKAYTGDLAHMLVGMAAVKQLVFGPDVPDDQRFGLEPLDFTLQNGGRIDLRTKIGDVEIVRIATGVHADEDERTLAAHTFQGRLELGVATRGFSYSRREMIAWLDVGAQTLVDASHAP